MNRLCDELIIEEHRGLQLRIQTISRERQPPPPLSRFRSAKRLHVRCWSRQLLTNRRLDKLKIYIQTWYIYPGKFCGCNNNLCVEHHDHQLCGVWHHHENVFPGLRQHMLHQTLITLYKPGRFYQINGTRRKPRTLKAYLPQTECRSTLWGGTSIVAREAQHGGTCRGALRTSPPTRSTSGFYSTK